MPNGEFEKLLEKIIAQNNIPLNNRKGIDFNSPHLRWEFYRAFEKALQTNSDKGPSILYEGSRKVGEVILYKFIEGKSPSEMREVLGLACERNLCGL